MTLVITCNDLLVKGFGYRDLSRASWFRKIQSNTALVVRKDNVQWFTARGLQYSLNRASRIPQDLELLQAVCTANNLDMPISRFKPENNYLYVIQFDNDSYIKVGISSNMSTRLRCYQTSHWTVNLLKQYDVSESQKKSIELQCFALLRQEGLLQKQEKFKLTNPTQLPQILAKIDLFMQQFAQ